MPDLTTMLFINCKFFKNVWKETTAATVKLTSLSLPWEYGLICCKLDFSIRNRMSAWRLLVKKNINVLKNGEFIIITFRKKNQLCYLLHWMCWLYYKYFFLKNTEMNSLWFVHVFFFCFGPTKVYHIYFPCHR